MKLIDDMVREPLGGAHRDPQEAAANIRAMIQKYAKELEGADREALIADRYEKFRRIGVFENLGSQPARRVQPRYERRREKRVSST
jgi:acetyl-CoA carboxylase carboxyl transferase subunit alpha